MPADPSDLNEAFPDGAPVINVREFAVATGYDEATGTDTAMLSVNDPEHGRYIVVWPPESAYKMAGAMAVLVGRQRLVGGTDQ